MNLKFLHKAQSLLPPKEKTNLLFSYLKEKYNNSPDPWGLDLDLCRKVFEMSWPLYRHYFNVKVHGVENVEDHPYMVVSNHTGQIPIDGLVIACAFMWEIYPPRILRGMVERFVPKIPFIGTLIAQGGSILGDRQNCNYLLERGESTLVFPEGVRGISKSTKDYYKLQSFTRGFFRQALVSQIDILPIAVVGAEDTFPYVYHPKKLMKLFGLPAFPLTPFPLPLPSPIDIYIGKPYKVPKDLSSDAPEKEINKHVFKIENEIKEMIANGLKNKRTIMKRD
ncbi:MAG: lysophospholipid acyltransferase family protein [Bacteriovoracaceae bacterium]